MHLKLTHLFAILRSDVVSISLGVLLVVVSFFILVFGFMILPRNAGRREWKRTLGVWSISVACALFAATIFFFEHATEDISIPVLFWLGGVIALCMGALLIWDKIHAAPAPPPSVADEESSP